MKTGIHDDPGGDESEDQPPYAGIAGGAVGGTPAQKRARSGHGRGGIGPKSVHRGDSTIGAGTRPPRPRAKAKRCEPAVRQLQRLQNEAVATATLHHTNIVPVYFVGCERGVHYYAMQFIEGHTLAEVIQNLTPRPPSRSGEGEPAVSPPRCGEGSGEGLSSTALDALSTLRSTKRSRVLRLRDLDQEDDDARRHQRVVDHVHEA